MNLKFGKFIAGLLVGSLLIGCGTPAQAKSPRGWGWATQKFKRAALSDPKTPKD